MNNFKLPIGLENNLDTNLAGFILLLADKHPTKLSRDTQKSKKYASICLKCTLFHNTGQAEENRGIDNRTGFWTSTENVYEEDDVNDGLLFHLDLDSDPESDLFSEEYWDVASSWGKGNGYSVRLIKDV